MRRFCMFMVLLAMLTGCDLLGPSKKDVKASLDAVGRALDASATKALKPEIHSEYINAADLTFRTENDATVHTMSIFFDTDDQTGSVKGACTFADYRDAVSGYAINGSFTYDFKGIKQSRPEDMYGEISCKVTLSGGKISSPDVKVSKDKDGVLENTLIANGKKIDNENWEKAFQVIRSLNPSLLPQ